MKPFLTILLLFSALIISYAQPHQEKPLDVLMIGTSHNYGKKPVERFDSIIHKAASFHPQAIFGEWLSAEDYNALATYWNKATVERRLAYLKSLPYKDPKNASKLIRQTDKLLRQYPNIHQARMRLARALYVQHDFANAAYQLYRLDRARPMFGPEEQTAYQTILGVPDSLYRNRSNEYHNILFPLIDTLQLGRILPMDSQRHDQNWSKAWATTDSLVHVWEKGLDSNSVEGKQYVALMKHTSDLWEEERKCERAGQATVFFNSPAGDELLNIVNFYGARRLYGVAGFPEKAMEAMLEQFRLRNDDMVHNLVNRSRAVGAKRVVVGVGANHRKIMVDMLRAMPGVTVYELNTYEGQ